MSLTKYYVMRQNEDGRWEEYNPEVHATSRDGALRAASVSPSDGNGSQFVAIPLRSWKPTKVQMQTKLQLKIG